MNNRILMIRLSQEDYDSVKALASKDGRSMAGYIRLLIRKMMARFNSRIK